MKTPLKIDETLLSGMTPEPDERFIRDMERLIDQLPKKERMIVKKKISMAAVVLAVLLLLCATAMAIGLSVDEIWKQSFEKMNTTAAITDISTPTQEDMTAEEAIEIAKNAIRAAYGTTDEEFARMGVYPTFFARGWHEDAKDDPAEWTIYFSSRTDVDLDLDTVWYGPDGEYRVYINAETKEIMYINWYTNDFWSKAQRVWDCGNYEEVYRHYCKPAFYSQSIERQEYFQQLLKEKGFTLISQDRKHHDLLLKRSLDLLFINPADAIAPGEDEQADAAWTELLMQYGLDPEVLQKYAYQATRADLNTGTDDIFIAYNFEEEFDRLEAAAIDPWCDRLFANVRRLGLFMVSFVPETTELVQVTNVPFFEVQNCESVAEGRLLEKTVWTSKELYLFDEAYTALENAIARMIVAGASEEEKRLVTHEYMRSLGGNLDIYEAAPDGYDMTRWFEGEPVENPITKKAQQMLEEYGPNTMFWPLEAQAELLGEPKLSVPKEGEMTQQQAAQKAKDAIVEKAGEDAFETLGEVYFFGYRLYRFENNGECTRWHVYVTDDPVRMENGWEVSFVDQNSEHLGSGCEVKHITDPGNG